MGDRRTLTGAWIETELNPFRPPEPLVAPSRVRGLKLVNSALCNAAKESHPHGCVD